MLYSELAETFDKLESTGGRLEMTEILASFFRSADPKELRSIVYLSQGKLHPDFEPGVLGMADRLVIKAIAFTSGTPEAEAERIAIDTGDPGNAAETLLSKKKQTVLFSEDLTVKRVIDGFTAIQNAEGKDSQNRKMKILANMLHDAGPKEARYLCRTVTGRMRVGAADMTILDALARAFATKEDRAEIERAFNVTCDIGLVAETIATGGMDAVREVRVSVGNPVKVMLAERLPSVPEILEKMGGRCAMEYKYDGIRVQAHIGKTVKLFSRRLEDMTSNFPDIAAALRGACGYGEAIVEGECVAVDSEGNMLPFQNVTHRRKKHGIDEAVKEIPVNIFLFDCLYRDGEDMTSAPYTERRRAIESGFRLPDAIVRMTEMRVVEDSEHGEEFFSEAIGSRCEGIVAKSVSPDSVYRAGSRGFLWIKYKKDYRQSLTDSFDLAVVGAFYGMGKRAGKYGALLMASFNTATGMFETVCKLGTGFDDAFLENMNSLLDGGLSESKPSSVDSVMVPDVWFNPSVVLEVIAAEITLSPIHTAGMNSVKEGAGLGIRFPRFTGRVRDDKAPEDCTTVDEIVTMYEMQGDSDIDN